jgi:hypothetical protein
MSPFSAEPRANVQRSDAETEARQTGSGVLACAAAGTATGAPP